MTDLQQFVPVLTAAVAAADALAGAFGGPWIKARSDVDQWRREQRMDAYADLARGIHDLTVAIAQRRDAADFEIDVARQAVEQAQYELLRAAASVQLVGPPAVRNASVALASHIRDLTRVVSETDPPV